MAIRKVTTYWLHAKDGTSVEIEPNTSDISLTHRWADDEMNGAFELGYDQIPELIEVLQAILEGRN